jgi:hypothetical protein
MGKVSLRLLAASLLVVLAACGGSKEPVADPDAGAAPTPAEASSAPPEEEGPDTFPEGYAIDPGDYVSDPFVPQFTYTSSSTVWNSDIVQSDVFAFFFQNPDGPADVILSRTDKWYDPKSLKVGSAPDGLLAALKTSPYLEVIGDGTTKVGKQNAPFIDVRVTKAPKPVPKGCEESCVPLTETDFLTVAVNADEDARLIELDAGNETVLIVIEAWEKPSGFASSALSFKDLLPKATKLLQEVNF